jgi:arylsulfatase A-like enzyme
MEVEVVDEMIERLVTGLKNEKILDDTILSVTSDHGEELWEHGSFSHGASAMYNEVIRTPWILNRPIGGGRIDANVSHTNVLPTVLDLAGIEVADEFRSKSVKRLIGQTEEPGDTPSAVYCETAQLVSVVSGEFKLIAPNKRTRFRSAKERLRYKVSRARRRLGGMADRPVELYNLRFDPGEKTNIASSEKETVARLTKLIDAYCAGERVTFGEGQNLTEAEEERIRKELEGLGYY